MQASSLLSNIAFQLRFFWLQTLVANYLQSIQNHSKDRFKRLRAVIWSRYAHCAVGLEAEQIPPISLTGCRYRTAALPRIRLGTLGFVSTPYFYPEKNAWSNEQSDERCFGREQVLANSIENFISHGKQISVVSDLRWLVTVRNLQSIFKFLTLEVS